MGPADADGAAVTGAAGGLAAAGAASTLLLDDSSSGPWVEATTQRTPRVRAAVQVARVVSRATGGTKAEGGAKWNHSESMAAFSTPLIP